MSRLFVLAAASAALLTSACVSITIKDDEAFNWSGQNAQPFDASIEACRAYAGRDQSTPAFTACMAERGWRRND